MFKEHDRVYAGAVDAGWTGGMTGVDGGGRFHR